MSSRQNELLLELREKYFEAVMGRGCIFSLLFPLVYLFFAWLFPSYITGSLLDVISIIWGHFIGQVCWYVLKFQKAKRKLKEGD